MNTPREFGIRRKDIKLRENTSWCNQCGFYRRPLDEWRADHSVDLDDANDWLVNNDKSPWTARIIKCLIPINQKLYEN